MKEKANKELAKILWDYNNIETPLEKADIILGLGNQELRCAEHAAKLFLDGWAPLVVFTGKHGRLTKNVFKKTEAEVFADVAIKMGVPEGKIIIEPNATNTGENIEFTKKILKEKGIKVNKLIVVTKAYMLRRALATFKKVWPGKELILSAPKVSFEEYCEEKSKDVFINTLVADTQRIIIYPERGFQIPQPMPDEVKKAYEELIKRGYNKQLLATD
jgi:uncharacterized SAM-binding protein YcdF (DUF218 family)